MDFKTFLEITQSPFTKQWENLQTIPHYASFALNYISPLVNTIKNKSIKSIVNQIILEINKCIDSINKFNVYIKNSKQHPQSAASSFYTLSEERQFANKALSLARKIEMYEDSEEAVNVEYIPLAILELAKGVHKVIFKNENILNYIKNAMYFVALAGGNSEEEAFQSAEKVTSSIKPKVTTYR